MLREAGAQGQVPGGTLLGFRAGAPSLRGKGAAGVALSCVLPLGVRGPPRLLAWELRHLPRVLAFGQRQG